MKQVIKVRPDKIVVDDVICRNFGEWFFIVYIERMNGRYEPIVGNIGPFTTLQDAEHSRRALIDVLW